jgi:hypothetical protein
LTAEQLFFEKLLERMERSDAKMTTLLERTGEFHHSMTIRAEEADRRIQQLAEQYQGLKKRGNLLLGEQK